MSIEIIEHEIEMIIGTKPDEESLNTIHWFKNNNPTYDLDTIILDYYGR